VFYSIDHLVEARRCAFHIEMFVLPGPAFRSQHSTTVDFLEIAIGKLVPSLRLRILLIVYGQVPFGVLTNTVPPDKLVFHRGRRLVFAPCIPAISHNLPLSDKFFGELE
jgi:hypothetical protein